MTAIPQLFITQKTGVLQFSLAKIVDGIIIIGFPEIISRLIKDIDDKFQLNTIENDPGRMRFFERCEY